MKPHPAAPSDQSELRELIERQIERTIAPDELQRLNSLLLDDPAARRFYLEYHDLHGLLSWSTGREAAVDSQDLRKLVLGEEELALAVAETGSQQLEGGPAAEFVAEALVAGPSISDRWKRSAGRTSDGGGLRGWGRRTARYLKKPQGTSLAVATLVTTSILLLLAMIVVPAHQVGQRHASTERPEFVARIGLTNQPRWADDMPLEWLTSGESLERDQRLHLLDGLAEVRFDSGAVLLMQGPAELLLRGKNRASLRHGRAVARVPERASGFVVQTALVEVVDLGTRFGMLVEPNRSCEVHVFEGLVEVAETASSENVHRLRENESIRFDAAAGTFSETTGSGADFVRTISSAEDMPPLPADAYGRAVLADNPVAYWRLRDVRRGIAWEPAGGRHGILSPRRIGGEEDRPPRDVPRADADGRLLLPLRGFRFDGRQQRIDVSYSPDLNTPSFTVEMWVRPEGPISEIRSPLSSREAAPRPRVSGYMLYAMPNDVWNFWTGHVPQRDDWSRLGDPPVDAGAWTHLAATFDAEEAYDHETYRGAKRLYVNGRLVAEADRLYSPNLSAPLRIGAGSTETFDPRYLFAGEVAEVAYYNRSLSGERIAVRHELGRRMATLNREDADEQP